MKPFNFLPDDYRQKRSQQRLNLVYLGFLLFIFAGLALSLTLLERKKQHIDNQIDSLEMEIETTQATLSKYETLNHQRQQLLSKANLSTSLVAPIPQSLLLACITNKLPENVYLTHYEVISRKIIPTTPPPAASKVKTNAKAAPAKAANDQPPKLKTTIEIQGQAQSDYDIAQYVGNLNQTEFFEKVYLHYVKEDKADPSLRCYKLSGELNDHIKITPKLVSALAKSSSNAHPNQNKGLFKKVFTSLFKK